MIDNAALDLSAVIADRNTKIIICCGSGGVGKTTTSAALALRAAEAGRRTVVLTIDPARRLAQSLGVGRLDNTPRPVAGIDTGAGGSLDAMMLDMKRTFDDVVAMHATPEKADAIFANPFYQALSTSFSGTQEYMAMEKLGQLSAQAESDGRWDLIIVDTPPSRSALDFLDAPEHISSLLDGKFLRLLLTPAKGPFRLMSVGFNFAYTAMEKVLGAQIITDVKTFAAAFETLFGGFRARSTETLRLLSSDRTTFVVVATPEPDALREASFFVDRLTESRLPLSGLVVNRTHSSELEISADRALALAEDLAADQGSDSHAAEVAALRRHADRMRMIDREHRLLNRFTSSRPDVAMTRVPALPSDVTDLATLRRLGESF
ncbi:ArsA family ATPase [Microlunatus soli]|uniref:Anion-transporting ATPase, ArsA/GET3 family n=1 Tax=Microlunatus soli TaxID=630515 RepID=A0A1H1T208_9ACTN|nr:ArsA-related P-loop ATPase [Microlunatus soli]SDS54295.1 Anion-transporting ATPase, ArsA/GET3 family [Microlunatus soli]